MAICWSWGQKGPTCTKLVVGQADFPTTLSEPFSAKRLCLCLKKVATQGQFQHSTDGFQTTTQGLGNLGRVALAPFCHPDPLPGGSYRPVPATSSFEPLLGRVLRLSGLHNRSTMGTQGPNVVPPSAHGHYDIYVPIFMGWPCP